MLYLRAPAKRASRPQAHARVALLLVSLAGCERQEPEPLVVLVGLDGASLSDIDELRAKGRLPNLDRLIRRGTSGPLQSWASKPIVSDHLRRGFWSPIVWTSIATGKIPEKHGVRDFVLPVPGTSSVWVRNVDGIASGRVRLPELNGRAPLALKLRLRSHGTLGEQDVRVRWNGSPLETVRVGREWTDVEVELDEDQLTPIENDLELVFSREHNGRAGELSRIDVLDASRRELFALDPVYERDRLGGGFETPRGQMTEIQSVHWREKPMWSLLDDADVPVGVIGWWGTWPAYPVNGFLVSSRMGIAEQRHGSAALAWPEGLSSELETFAPGVDDLAETFERLGATGCDPPLIDRQSVLKKILIQDEFYVRIAQRQLPKMDSGLFAVYLRSIDVAGHPTLHWKQGAALPETCPESVREINGRVYDQIDAWLGEMLESLPRPATVVLVSDHGMQPVEGGGHHAPFGLVVASGDGIRRNATIDGSTVLDIAPTILHLARAGVPLDMDGQVLTALFEETWLRSHAPRYVDIDSSLDHDAEVPTDVSEDALEELRSLGYIQ